MRKNIFLAAVACMAFFVANAQSVSGDVQTSPKVNKYLDYNYDKLSVKERKPLPFPSLREADAVYAKRMQRVIDVREKKNLPLDWPGNPLWRVLRNNIMAGEGKGYGKLKAYKNDSMGSLYTVGDMEKKGSTPITMDVIVNPDYPDFTKSIDTIIPFEWNTVTRYLISEEWIFDKQRSAFFPRIIAIAPLFIMKRSGVDLGEQMLCWINNNDFRKIAINEEVFNRSNDAERLTYNDFFEQRLFSSYITKESNEFDAAINELPEFKDDPMGALYESERIKDNLFNWEHDLWEY